MPIGQSYASGYNTTRKQRRSFMPAVNTLSGIIANRRRGGGRGRRIQFNEGPTADERSDLFFGEIEAKKDKEIEYNEFQEAKRKEDYRYERDQSLLESEEARRQESHDQDIAAQQQGMEQQDQLFDRATAKDDRVQAYEMVKQGLMSRDSRVINEAMSKLAPESADVITEGEPVDGARSFTGRKEVPQFIFDPDSDVVGVIFPGQDKPTVFKDTEQAFQQVLAPLNPAHEKTKDEVAADKNRSEAQLKRKKLDSENHWKAHEAAMGEFVADGYFQAALFDQKKYDQSYWRHIARANNMTVSEAKAAFDPPPKVTDKQKKAQAIPDNIYKGDEPPAGFPDARRGKDGGWYVKKGNGWAPIVEGKEKMKKGENPMQTAGPSLRGTGGKTVIRKKIPGMVGASRG